MAGVDFVYNFLKSNKAISLWKPQGVSINRVYGVNCESVGLYFQDVKSLPQEHGFQPHQIYNVDYSGLTYKPVKAVLAGKGKHCVSSITSREKGVTTIVVLVPLLIMCLIF